MSELTNTPRSSYARLFDTGNNYELSRQIGELFTHFQSHDRRKWFGQSSTLSFELSRL